MSGWNFPDKTDIHGVSGMIRTDDIDSNADLELIEKNIIRGIFPNPDDKEVPSFDKFKLDIDNIADNEEPRYSEPARSAGRSVVSFHDDRRSNFDDRKSAGISARDDDYSRHSSPRRERHENYDDSPNQREIFDSYSNERSANNDNKLNQYRTKELNRAEALKQFFQGDDNDDENDGKDRYSIEPGRLEDDRVVMLQQIDNLKVELEMEGCDISKFEVAENDSYDKIQDMWRKLKLKSQYKTYSNMFEESILLGAEFVEWAFDGDKEYLGYKPCMTGWGDTVKLKLKRMRLETASFVSGVMQEYKMSAGLSIMTQLVVSGVLYSVTKRKNDEEMDEQSRHVTDKEFRDAMIDMD